MYTNEKLERMKNATKKGERKTFGGKSTTADYDMRTRHVCDTSYSVPHFASLAPPR